MQNNYILRAAFIAAHFRKVGTMDLEELIITMLDTIEEADDNGADEVVFRFNEKLIHKVAEAYREVEEIEIY